MGAPKQKWTSEEEEALRAGVDKHGPGRWREIQKDPEFSHCLAARTNIDLKDKWRNMSVSASGQGSRDKTRAPKGKNVPSIPFSSTENPASSAPVKQEAQPANPSTNVQDSKPSSRYASMIIEAISAMRDPNGSEIGAICNFIGQRHEVPPNFRKLLSSKLRRLVSQDKIEKVQRGYKLKDSSFATKTPNLKQKDPAHRSRPPQPSSIASPSETAAEAANAAVYKVAEAEAKSFLASEAVKAAERVARMEEEAESMVMLARELFDQCSQGELITLDFKDANKSGFSATHHSCFSGLSY